MEDEKNKQKEMSLEKADNFWQKASVMKIAHTEIIKSNNQF